MFRVDSEVGRLRQVILHRPDLELKRLTPDNAAELLFDDLLWVAEAQAEHDAFADALRGRGVVVHYYASLLAQTLEIADAREFVLDRVFDPRLHGPLACAALRGAVHGLGSGELAQYLVGGIDEAARVHHQHVGLIRMRRQLVPAGHKLAHHDFAIHQIFGTAQRSE